MCHRRFCLFRNTEIAHFHFADEIILSRKPSGISLLLPSPPITKSPIGGLTVPFTSLHSGKSCWIVVHDKCLIAPTFLPFPRCIRVERGEAGETDPKKFLSSLCTGTGFPVLQITECLCLCIWTLHNCQENNRVRLRLQNNIVKSLHIYIWQP